LIFEDPIDFLNLRVLMVTARAFIANFLEGFI
jgi:hypothetical protein